MNVYTISAFALVSLACAPGSLAQPPKPQIEEQIVGPAWVQGTLYTISEKGMRVASTHPKGGKFVVTIDGVDGEEFDQIINTVPVFETSYNDAGLILIQRVERQGPVALSRDGKRYAYAGVRGTEVIVILDGKEIFRAPQSASASPVSLLQFTPDGKHLYFYNQTGDTMQSFRLMMDGKPVTPSFDQTPQPHFSSDGSRWLLSAGKAKQPNEKFLIIDGKDAGYSGERVRFSPDGKHVVCTTGARGDQKLLLDRKPILSTVFIERFRIGATGDVAAIVQSSHEHQKQTLYINGKSVPDSEGVLDVLFSPDGKRWAARLQRDMGTVAWVMVDGKKHTEFKSVHGLRFSPDSTLLGYVASNGPKSFVLINGEEDEGHGIVRSSPTFAKTGHKFVYAAGPQNPALKIHHNGKASKIHNNIFALALSPDGERCAYFAGIDAVTTEFFVDGEPVTRDGAFGGTLVFSPDSKHLAASTRRPDGYATIYIDGTFLPERLATGVVKEFTPDSQHVIITAGGVDENKMSVIRYYLNGDPVAEFSGRAVPWINSPKMKREVTGVMPFGISSKIPDSEAKDWEFRPDGSIVFVGAAVGPGGYGPMKRIKVTPAPGTSFMSWVTSVKASEEKAVADAAAAKAKAVSDKAASAAKAKADADAAAAKRKADYEAAVAAKAKARQDALDARKKAQADAAAKRGK